MEKLIVGTGKVLAEKKGSGVANRVMRNAQARFEELARENAGESKALKAHTIGRIYPGIAIYESMLKEDIDSEEAVWMIREYFQRYCAKVVPHLKRIIALPGVAKRFPKMFTKMSLSSFSPDAGFEYEFPETSGNESRFNIVKCPYWEACQRYACTEIVKAFCDSDDASYGDLHKNLKWGRTKTIGHDGDCCNFLLEYKEK